MSPACAWATRQAVDESSDAALTCASRWRNVSAVMKNLRPLAPALLCLVALAGCAHYEYDIVKPPDLAQHVGSKAAVRFTIGDLEYALQTSESHLVMIV